jgi:hypothetical protein
MDTGNMTFGEILFNGRYHIIGGVMFLVFVAAFAREVIRELAATVTERRRVAHRHNMGVFVPDMMLGATMTDGGEPVEQDKKQTDETSSPQD